MDSMNLTHVSYLMNLSHVMRTYYRCEKFVRVLHRICHAVIYLSIDRSESRTRGTLEAEKHSHGFSAIV